MKALTLLQPWASLVALGHKKVETRIWSTRYRGPLAIHSALRKPVFLGKSCESEEFGDLLEKLKMHDHRYTYGCVLCVVNLVAIAPSGDVYDDLTYQERLLGNYEEGRYAWFLEMVEKFEVPVPAKGNRMLWNWERALNLRTETA